MKSLPTLAALAAVLWLAPAAFAATPRVLAVEFQNDVNPVTADFVIDQLERANEGGFSAIVILLDTPGGLSTAMEDIYKAQLASDVPVIVYVAPAGAEATSAGVFVAQAADVLAMAPATSIGSSTPIGAGGEDLGDDIRKKAVNKFASSLRGLAERHGRNGEWAERAVREAANLTAREAVEQNVADLVSPNLPALLERIDGERADGKPIETAGAEIVRAEMSLWTRILDLLVDPNLIALMLSLGTLGIVVELWNPGLIFPGTVGAICLILGMAGLSVLPFSWAGVLLMLLAAGFFAAEVAIVSHGALALAGSVSFVFGALMLFDPAGEAYQVSLPVAISIAGTVGAFVVFALTKAVTARRNPVEVGVHGLVGQTAIVRGPGLVFANGELWQAHSDEPLQPGDEVVVEAVDGLTLDVTPRERVGSGS